MRGILAVIITIFAVFILFLLGGAAVEPIGGIVQDSGSGSAIGQSGIVQSYYDMIFIGAPLVLMVGMIGWALAWYFRQEGFQGGRR
jgi:hypothetical protein